MEVVCRDTLSGDEHVLPVSDDAAVQDLVAEACALFGRTAAEAADLTLSFAGLALTDPVSETALEGGAAVDLVRSTARVLRLVQEGAKAEELPGWAAADREVVLAAIDYEQAARRRGAPRYGGGRFSLAWAAAEMRGDREVVLTCVGCSATALMLEAASAELRDDDGVVMLAVANSGFALQHASARLRADRRVVLAAVAEAGGSLQYADAAFGADKAVVLCALRHGASIEHVSPELRSDKDVALAAVRRDGAAVAHVSEELRADLHVGLVAVCVTPKAIEHMPVLSNDKEVMLHVVRSDPGALSLLRYAGPELRDDRELVLLAVSRCGDSLAFASERLRDDKEVVLAALRKQAKTSRGGNDRVLKHVSARLLHDVDVFEASGHHFVDLSPFAHFSSDKEVVMAFLARNTGCSVLEFVDDSLRADKEVVVAACSKYGLEYDHIPAAFKDDKDVILAAMTAYGGPRWENVPAKWKGDPDVAVAASRNLFSPVAEVVAVVEGARETALAAVRLGGSSLLDGMKPEFQTDKDFLLAAVARDGASALPAPSLQGGVDREVLLAAARSGAYFRTFSDEHPNFSASALDDKELVLEMVKRANDDDDIFKSVSKRLQADPDVLETARLRKGVVYTNSEMEYLVSLDEVAFPPSTGLQVNMMPFLMEPLFSLTRLPESLRAYWTTMVKPQLGLLKEQHGAVCYLSVDERDVSENQSHRRPGLHTESPGRLLEDVRVDAAADHVGSSSYSSNLHWGYATATLSGGLFVVSNVEDSCAAWACAVAEAKGDEPPLIKPHGDVEHLRPILEADPKRQARMAANRMYWMTDRTPHESLPLKKACHRQWFRLVTSAVSAWFVDHSTPNPNGVVPDPDVTITLKGDKFDVENLELLHADEK